MNGICLYVRGLCLFNGDILTPGGRGSSLGALEKYYFEMHNNYDNIVGERHFYGFVSFRPHGQLLTEAATNLSEYSALTTIGVYVLVLFRRFLLLYEGNDRAKRSGAI